MWIWFDGTCILASSVSLLLIEIIMPWCIAIRVVKSSLVIFSWILIPLFIDLPVDNKKKKKRHLTWKRYHVMPTLNGCDGKWHNRDHWWEEIQENMEFNEFCHWGTLFKGILSFCYLNLFEEYQVARDIQMEDNALFFLFKALITWNWKLFNALFHMYHSLC